LISGRRYDPKTLGCRSEVAHGKSGNGLQIQVWSEPSYYFWKFIRPHQVLTLFLMLFLECACMTGDAHPFAVQINPRVRESPIMIKGLTFVEPFGVIDSSNHGYISI